MSIYLECNKCCAPGPRSPGVRAGAPCMQRDCDGHLIKTNDALELEHDYEVDHDEEDYDD